MVHKAMADQAMLKVELEKAAHVRVQPDQFNYRSPKKYVSNYLGVTIFIFILC